MDMRHYVQEIYKHSKKILKKIHLFLKYTSDISMITQYFLGVYKLPNGFEAIIEKH